MLAHFGNAFFADEMTAVISPLLTSATRFVSIPKAGSNRGGAP